MAEIDLTPTANRSVAGVLNEFAYLTDVHQPEPNGLLGLSLRLATTEDPRVGGLSGLRLWHIRGGRPGVSRSGDRLSPMIVTPV